MYNEIIVLRGEKMDQKTKEAYDRQYKSIEEIRLLVENMKMETGREIFSHIECFG